MHFCYKRNTNPFDDVVHKLLGFSDNSYQSLYHFTIGGALEDERITTLPPYYHLKNSDHSANNQHIYTRMKEIKD